MELNTNPEIDKEGLGVSHQKKIYGLELKETKMETQTEKYGN